MTGAGRRHLLGLAAAAALTTAAEAEPAPGEPRSHQVTIRNVAYVPAQITLRPGDSIVWTNDDIVAHTATSRTGGFNLQLPPGGTSSVIMARPGIFDYTCLFHPNMRGRIIVER